MSTTFGNDRSSPFARLRTAGTLGSVSTLAERVRIALDRSGLSQRALSLRAGLSGSYVGLVLRGTLGKRPGDEAVTALARAAGVSRRWLATGEGTPDSPDIPLRQEVAPVPPPTFAELPDWPALRDAARAIDPGVPGWTFEELGAARPVLDLPATPAVLAALARVLFTHRGQKRAT